MPLELPTIEVSDKHRIAAQLNRLDGSQIKALLEGVAHNFILRSQAAEGPRVANLRALGEHLGAFVQGNLLIGELQPRP